MKYKMYASCKLCRGHCRSAIYDLQRSKYFLIPNSLFALFDKDNTLVIPENECTEEELNIINEYISFLNENELIYLFDDDEISHFPPMSEEWDFPSVITNLIVDVRNLELNWEEIRTQMEEMKCYYLQVRILNQANLSYIKHISNVFFNSLVLGLEIITKYDKDLDIGNLANFIAENPKIRSLIYHGAPTSQEILPANEGFGGIFFIDEKIESHKSCGIVSPSYFMCNVETYTESLHFNTCLNRKISIDENGEIKNCPSMLQSYGNIADIKLIDVAKNKDFQKKWNIAKDSITKCKDCEFRHICIDCRAFTEDPDDIYAAPLKCGYDPYTGNWENWKTDTRKKEMVERFFNHSSMTIG